MSADHSPARLRALADALERIAPASPADEIESFEEAAAHLRRLAALDHGLAWGAQHMAERIAALEAENERLRAALERSGYEVPEPVEGAE